MSTRTILSSNNGERLSKGFDAVDMLGFYGDFLVRILWRQTVVKRIATEIGFRRRTRPPATTTAGAPKPRAPDRD